MIRSTTPFIVLAGGLLGVTPSSNARAASDDAAEVVVSVGPFESGEGYLGCRLFDAERGFPEANTSWETRARVQGSRMTCRFDGLDPGVYAVSVMHDANGNHRLDKNLFGVPVEGYGVSNNRTHAVSKPRWRECKFQVSEGQVKRLNVNLRY